MTYVPLGVRTEYSFLDGMCRVEALIERARALRLGVVGIADLHSAYGLVPFQAAARAAGIRPILGVTVRLQADVAGQESWGQGATYLKLLARDADGYRNLLRLLTRSHLEAGPGEPGVGFQDLEAFASGVQALDGGPLGPVAQSLVGGARDEAERVAARLREIFGADGFCMEVQRQGAAEETILEPFVVQIARRLNVPLVATCDARYLEPADADAHEVLRCIREGTTLVLGAERRFAGEAYLLRSDLEMRQLFRDLPEALANTCMVAERCQVDLELATGRVPDYRPDSGRAPLDELRRACERGACERYGARGLEDLPAAVRDRLAHELSVIEEMELASCFLIARDVVRYAKGEGISIGPGRGAAAGSLVCYVTGVAGIDPLEHGLRFERFVTRNGGGLPEFEFDVEHRRRDELVQHFLQALGPERVAQAASLTTLSTRSVVREVAQALGFRPEEIEEIGRSLRAEGAADLWQALDRSPGLKRSYQEDARVRRLLDVARRLEGLPRLPTLHAGGLLVAPGCITDHAALQRSRTGEPIAQLTHEGAHALGMLRLDLVASRPLSVIQGTLRLLADRKGIGLAVESLPLDDEPTLRALAQGDTSGITQLDGPSAQALLREVEPTRFEDLVAALCLGRPGARSAGLAERFVARRRAAGEEPPGDERLRPILESTHGLLLYQEQVMEVAIGVAGYDGDDAEALRHALQRRRIGDLARHRARFVRGAVERGAPLAAAEEIFGSLLKFANFDFDKAHGTGAALLAYAGAFLRAHHPVEYAAAWLEEAAGQHQRVIEALVDALAHGVRISPVDVNRSAPGFAVEGRGLRIGLAQVKRVSDAEAARLVEERGRGGRFESLGDLCRRLPDVPRPAIENLVRAGAFDGLGIGRARGMAELEAILEGVAREVRQRAATGQLELDFGDPLRSGRLLAAAEVEEFPRAELARLEREALDYGVDLDSLRREAELRRRGDLQSSVSLARLPEAASVRVAGSVVEVREVRTRRGEPMAFLKLQDLGGELEVVVFPRTIPQVGSWLFDREAAPGMLVIVDGSVEHQREATRVVARRIEKLTCRESTGDATRGMLFPIEDASDRNRIRAQGSPPQPNAERQAGALGSGRAKPRPGHVTPAETDEAGGGRRGAPAPGDRRRRGAR